MPEGLGVRGPGVPAADGATRSPRCFRHHHHYFVTFVIESSISNERNKFHKFHHIPPDLVSTWIHRQERDGVRVRCGAQLASGGNWPPLPANRLTWNFLPYSVACTAGREWTHVPFSPRSSHNFVAHKLTHVPSPLARTKSLSETEQKKNTVNYLVCGQACCLLRSAVDSDYTNNQATHR